VSGLAALGYSEGLGWPAIGLHDWYMTEHGTYRFECRPMGAENLVEDLDEVLQQVRGRLPV
jgi:hypothetical protein